MSAIEVEGVVRGPRCVGRQGIAGELFRESFRGLSGGFDARVVEGFSLHEDTDLRHIYSECLCSDKKKKADWGIASMIIPEFYKYECRKKYYSWTVLSDVF